MLRGPWLSNEHWMIFPSSRNLGRGEGRERREKSGGMVEGRGLVPVDVPMGRNRWIPLQICAGRKRWGERLPQAGGGMCGSATLSETLACFPTCDCLACLNPQMVTENLHGLLEDTN